MDFNRSDLVLVCAAAKELGFKNSREIYRKIEKGELKGVRFSIRKTFITRSSLIEYQKKIQLT